MAGGGLKALLAVALLAAGFQVYLKEFVWVLFGIGKVFQPLEDFQYDCRRIDDPRLQACEDMWLSEGTRQLFLACSDTLSRRYWTPALQHLNASGRSMVDAMIAMDIDKPQGKSFVYRVLSTPGFSGNNGDGKLNLVGFDGLESGAGEGGKTITLAMVNHRPALHPETGALVDNLKTGANSTVEIFEMTGPGTTEMKHVRTFASPNLSTPNQVAFAQDDPDGGFYFTNDHGPYKTGLKQQLGLLIPVGNVGYCGGPDCELVAEGFKFPNGLIRSHKDGLIYVPNSGAGPVHVFKPGGNGNHTLHEVATIPLPYSIDNLSEDSNGDIFAAVFPKPWETLASFHDPLHKWPTTAVIRIRRTAEEEPGKFTYTTEKILEDRDKAVLPGATTALHDAKTGRLFISGVASPFIAVCEPKSRP